MLLCTLTRDTWHKHWVTLQPWIVRDNKPCVAYLSCLLDYFDNAGNTLHLTFNSLIYSSLLLDIDLEAEMKFKRLNLDVKNAPQWQDSTQPLVKCEVVCPSHIGKQDHREVEVDFANKDIGYGPGKVTVFYIEVHIS